ncbi:unnamed protein product (macronuclear) [Paramecium tetraurelia]|uniref:RING-type domain-containing protein n=1 Tax=Paramecium tetraurelia TaxID=5888 RepID=A0C601_PARTE|nr:uncharacterized protein GSPATT00035347001 [Paramecium tetraurelia]CAK66218.1 unnamed protein product [Paramecium tetraurelia]|eukprot:XP_001433615.1 hypothetical protein (macronuclear) [Paramecium tetraurelia strain d4-2]
MSDDDTEIQYTYRNQTQTLKVKLNDFIYTKFQNLLNIDEDEFVIIIDNDYDQIIRKKSQFSETENKNYYIYNIKDLLKEKIPAVEKIAKDKNQQEQILHSTIIINAVNPTPLAEDQNDDIFQSVTLQVPYRCYNCESVILKDYIQLECLHHLHQECFLELIKNQIKNNGSSLKCQCNKQIRMKLVREYISDKDLIKNYFTNQLKIIQMDQQKLFKICQKKKSEQCSFFYIETNNQSVSYCEECDEQKQTQNIQN